MPPFRVPGLGRDGVNVDLDAREMSDQALRQAQNVIHEVLGAQAAVITRPGLLAFTTAAMGASVLGGIGVPLEDESAGAGTLYLGRGETL